MTKTIVIGLILALSSAAQATTSGGALSDLQNEAGIYNSGFAAFGVDEKGEEKPDQGEEYPDQGKDKPDQEHDHDDHDRKKYMRVDCRYHNEEGIPGIGHCYASAIYIPTEHGYKNVKLGIGCDYQTIYNDKGRVHTESLGERLSPETAAFPAIEISPEGSLASVGTYESVLDTRAGRMAGQCYVHKVGGHKRHGHHHEVMDVFGFME